MEKISYTLESLKKPYFWLSIFAAILLLALVFNGQDFDDFSYFSAIILLSLFVIVMLRENNTAIRVLKYKSGKRLTL
jgi:uncharacterized membrane protein